MTSLRFIFALAVIGGVSTDDNVTTAAPLTDATDGLAPHNCLLESAEKTQHSGEVRSGLGRDYWADWENTNTDKTGEEEVRFWNAD